MKAVHFQPQAQERLGEKTVHPAGAARIPCPAPSADMLAITVHVGGDDVRFDLVGFDRIQSLAVADRVYECQQLPGTVAVADGRKRHGGPHGGVCVLAPVFPHTRPVALDVARIQGRSVEWWVQKLNKAQIAADKAVVDCIQCGSRARWGPGARENRPALREQIDLALWTSSRTQRFAVVKVRTPVPLSVPGVLLDALAELRSLRLASLYESDVAAT